MTNWKSFLMGISQRAALDAKPMASNPTPCGEILGRVEGRVNKPGLRAGNSSHQPGAVTYLKGLTSMNRNKPRTNEARIVGHLSSHYGNIAGSVFVAGRISIV